jgi:membrane protein required for colicin V production
MVTIDYIILAIILLSAVVGIVRGFLQEICSLLTWVLAIWLAWVFGPSLVPYLGGVLTQEPYGLWAGRAIVFVGVLVLGAVVGFGINHFIRMSLFSGLDRMLGLLLGLVRGLVIVAFAIILAQAAQLDDEGWWERSKLVPVVKPVADLMRAVVGERAPSLAAHNAG